MRGGQHRRRRTGPPLLLDHPAADLPTTFFLLLTTIRTSLQAFDLLSIMSPQGTGTTTLMFDSYLEAFHLGNAGYSSAISTVLFGILLLMTVGQMTLLERRVHYR